MEPCETIKIGKISIDLASCNDMSRKNKCDHFTIRGFVSEARKKDWKLCWPFSSESDAVHLPPLHVPRYKFWGCESCLLELDVSSRTNDAVVIPSHGKEDDKIVEGNKKRDETATAASDKEKKGSEERETPHDENVVDVQSSKGGDASNENGGLSQRKRARKVRLLTDLLCPNALKEHKKVALMKRGLTHCKKRKSSNDEEWKPTCSNRVKKNTKGTRKEEKLPAEAPRTEDLESAFAKMSLQIGENDSPSKNKKQKSWILGEALPSLEIISKQGNAFNPLEVCDPGETREMDLFPLSASTLDLEKNSDDEYRRHSLFNSSEASFINEHADSSRDPSLDKALNLSLNSYISPQTSDFSNQQPAVTCNSSNPVLTKIGSGYRTSTCSYEKDNKRLYGRRSEQGEFPVDIVELRAQNQYERRHFDFPPVIDFSNVNSRKDTSVLHPETRNFRAIAEDFADPTIPNSFDFFSQSAVNIGQQGQPQIPVGFRPFLEHRDPTSSELQRCFPCISCQQQKKDTWLPCGYPLGGPSSNYLSRFPDFPRKEKQVNEAKKKRSVSLDLYSNEAIPAMHLLSLMDAGVGSSTKAADVQRGFGVSSSSRVSYFPQKLKEDKVPYLFASNYSNKAKNKLALPVCTVNRNPADFSFPDELNVYMIHGEMLKFDDAVDAEAAPSLKPKKSRPKIVPARAQRPPILNNVTLN